MNSDIKIGMRIFGITMRTLAFAALYITLISALAPTVARYTAVLPAMCFAAAFLTFDRKKAAIIAIIGAAALYSALCISISFYVFVDGAEIFGNAVSESVNANLSSGWEFAAVSYSAASDFVFSSVIAVWLALGSAAIARKSGFAFVVAALIIMLIWIMIGLLPEYYGVAPLITMSVALLIVDKGFSVRSAGIYLALIAAGFAALTPCVALYGGSYAIRSVRYNIESAANNILYGSDSLPLGELDEAGSLHENSGKARLKVTMSTRTPKLYLKGFVGSELTENVWRPTNKNKYVENGYQGIIDYVRQSGIPFTQYAKYSALSGNADKHSVTVSNVGANRRFMYVPYGLSEYSSGDIYYDMNIRNGVFADRTYSYSVFTGDGSSEWTTQEKWLLDPTLRTVAMNAYMNYENEYRAFVYDVYCDVDDNSAKLIRDKLFGISTDSINTAARLLRTFFEENFVHTDDVDDFGKDFIADFYNGKIHRANSVYFATAATYAFRALGFAARYVEGYLVESDEAIGTVTVNVTGAASHAWTEVYFDGIGWLPIEVTFEVKDPTIPVDPNDPNDPDNPPEPIDPDTPTPPDKPDPITPDLPSRGDGKPLSKSDKSLIIAIKVLLPIFAVLAAFALAVLAALARRHTVIRNKHKKLDCNGEAYGRAAYALVQRDCKSYGGFSEKMLEEKGVTTEHTRRFMQLVERCVYGGYELNDHEKSFIVHYMRSVAEALEGDGTVINKLICKYVKCLGI